MIKKIAAKIKNSHCPIRTFFILNSDLIHVPLIQYSTFSVTFALLPTTLSRRDTYIVIVYIKTNTMLKNYESGSVLTLAAMVIALLSLAGIFLVTLVKLSEMGL
ncbi:MAG: hypothetical protein H6550_14055 [Chitinophagales bacterium]|nr:hypothetical protein [Chitinophagales bacterium]